MKPKYEICCAFSELQVKETWELEQSYACFLFLFLKRVIQGIAFVFTIKVRKRAQVVNSLFSVNSRLVSALCIIFCEVLQVPAALIHTAGESLGAVCCLRCKTQGKQPLNFK